MNEALKAMINLDTAKVVIAAATPYAVWMTNLELALKVTAGIGAVVYIWFKVWLLYRKGSDE